VRATGGIGSEDADISNIKRGKNPLRRKFKVSCPTKIGAGLVGA